MEYDEVLVVLESNGVFGAFMADGIMDAKISAEEEGMKSPTVVTFAYGNDKVPVPVSGIAVHLDEKFPGILEASAKGLTAQEIIDAISLVEQGKVASVHGFDFRDDIDWLAGVMKDYPPEEIFFDFGGNRVRNLEMRIISKHEVEVPGFGIGTLSELAKKISDSVPYHISGKDCFFVVRNGISKSFRELETADFYCNDEIYPTLDGFSA